MLRSALTHLHAQHHTRQVHDEGVKLPIQQMLAAAAAAAPVMYWPAATASVTSRCLVFLSSHSIVQAIEAADEFFSACSADVSDDNEIFYDVSPPYEPLVGS
jgi:hypothetical protein